jgi:hypothetical protein
MQQVTWVCREEVTACPAYIHKRVAPLMGLIKADSHQQQQHHAGHGGTQPQQQQHQHQTQQQAPQQQQAAQGRS